MPSGGRSSSAARSKPRNPLYTGRRNGALAQLGERRLCKPEVTGSIPVRSTGAATRRNPFAPLRFPARGWEAGLRPLRCDDVGRRRHRRQSARENSLIRPIEGRSRVGVSKIARLADAERRRVVSRARHRQADDAPSTSSASPAAPSADPRRPRRVGRAAGSGSLVCDVRRAGRIRRFRQPRLKP